jgi:hypothetical protein
MHYQINLASHFDSLARAVTFEVQSIGQIELEALMLEICDGAPAGFLAFDGQMFQIHPVLLMAVLPMYTISVARLIGIEDRELDNPVAWLDAGYASTSAVLTMLFAEAAQKLMVWSSVALEQDGYCPLETLMTSIDTGESFDQVKIRSFFRHSGLRPVAAA